MGLSAGESALFVNGLLVDLDTLDVFQLLELLKREERLSAGFFKMGFRREYLALLMKMESGGDGAAGTVYGVDPRPAFPDYVNDLDKDPEYRQWGNSVQLMLQPYFPGMIRPIARNFFSLVFVVDPASPEARSLLKIAFSFYAHDIPIRVGLVFAVNPDKTAVSGLDDLGVALLNLYDFVKTDSKPAKALRALTELFDGHRDKELKVPDVHAFFKKKYRFQTSLPVSC